MKVTGTDSAEIQTRSTASNGKVSDVQTNKIVRVFNAEMSGVNGNAEEGLQRDICAHLALVASATELKKKTCPVTDPFSKQACRL